MRVENTTTVLSEEGGLNEAWKIKTPPKLSERPFLHFPYFHVPTGGFFIAEHVIHPCALRLVRTIWCDGRAGLKLNINSDSFPPRRLQHSTETNSSPTHHGTSSPAVGCFCDRDIFFPPSKLTSENFFCTGSKRTAAVKTAQMYTRAYLGGVLFALALFSC